ncbi:MAG: adenylyl-sulfate kinase [Actinomycetota bacterium]|nr:adenylyl-sulfate kinase [Actinomycetota bacterium]
MDQPKTSGLTVWFTGLPAAGKTTLARGLASRLAGDGRRVEVLDGDIVRTRLTRDLGFSKDDRIENVRRVGFVANLLSRNGVIVLCSVISPYRDAREEVRRLHGDRYLEVYVATPLDVCAARDPKGLYARQRAGDVHGLTGVDDPYEPPLNPDVVVPTETQSVEESVETVWKALPRSVRNGAP